MSNHIVPDYNKAYNWLKLHMFHKIMYVNTITFAVKTLNAVFSNDKTDTSPHSKHSCMFSIVLINLYGIFTHNNLTIMQSKSENPYRLHTVWYKVIIQKSK